MRRQRAAGRRARLFLAAAVVVAAGVPTAMLLSLWQNLTVTFWYNEQWRAYYISLPGNWWAGLKGDGGPFTAGWFFLERAAASLFGSTELVLRLPTALFLPLGCVLLLFLARRWMPLGAALVVALVGGLTGTLFIYAVQLSEYEIDAAAVVAIVLLHEIAGDVDASQWRSPRIYLAYAGVGLACVFSTPAVFVAAPILLLDTLRALRARALRPQTIGAAGAGLIAVLHLELFIRPQNALTKSDYWDVNFLPHNGVGNQIAFVWDGLRGFVTGTFTGSDVPYLPVLLSPRYSWILSVAFGVLFCLGVVVAARSPRGRALLVGIGGSLVLTLIASYVRYWPFGFVRTNFYLVPLLVLVAGIGAAGAATFLIGRIRARPDRAGPSRFVPPVVAASLALVILVVVAMAATYEAGSYWQVRKSVPSGAYGILIPSAVASVKEQAKSDTALVVVGIMAEQSWQYYQYEYSGALSHTGHQIGRDRAVFPLTHGSPSITRMVRRVHPRLLFLYVPFGTTYQEIEADMHDAAAGAGCVQFKQVTYTGSGLLESMSCSGHGAPT